MKKVFEKVPFVDQVLKGVGQIMLQENSWTGVLFLIGIFLGSWQCGLAAVVAGASGTLTAKFLKYDQKEINAGMYGFSASLVGVALAFLFQATVLIWVLIIVGSVLAAIFQNFFIARKLRAFSFPFIVISWVFVYSLQHYTQIPPSDLMSVKFEDSKFIDVFTAIQGFGEVIFQGSPLSGFLFFLGVFIGSPVAALYGLAGSLLSAYISQLNGEALEHVHMGLFGFNAVLSAIFFSGHKKIDGLWVLIAVVITAVLNDLIVDYKILDAFGGVFTFPFVATTWLTLLLKKVVLKKSV
ncbi:urea transporter [Chryseobacterium sp. MDT2-18]|uniref:urea transporter n=1 Tax=Chryseobacterium sp. MDT2-18 TaxID=1259136 RepID=UPI002783B8C5|nr:urea transporter [Chryseobacterium sp. MDT2-18]MDQ0477979.1 urea transporter [Chryseobacterium sp. MDT2-18]